MNGEIVKFMINLFKYNLRLGRDANWAPTLCKSEEFPLDLYNA